MPYVKEYEDGTLVGALTKAHADQLIADLAERSPGYLKKAATFRPDNPSRVLVGQRPDYPTRTANAKASEAFYAAVELVRRAFVEAEGRQPTAEDANFNTAVEQLSERYFPKSDHLTPAPVKKSDGTLIEKAMRGERVVLGEQVTPERPVRKRRGGLASSAMRGATAAIIPNTRAVIGGR